MSHELKKRNIGPAFRRHNPAALGLFKNHDRIIELVSSGNPEVGRLVKCSSWWNCAEVNCRSRTLGNSIGVETILVRGLSRVRI